MLADEHMNIAAHEHYQRNDGSAEREPNARHDIHGKLQRVREQPAVLDGGTARPQVAQQEPYVRAIKDA
jgi:hypothetical protein